MAGVSHPHSVWSLSSHKAFHWHKLNCTEIKNLDSINNPINNSCNVCVSQTEQCLCLTNQTIFVSHKRSNVCFSQTPITMLFSPLFTTTSLSWLLYILVTSQGAVACLTTHWKASDCFSSKCFCHGKWKLRQSDIVCGTSHVSLRSLAAFKSLSNSSARNVGIKFCERLKLKGLSAFVNSRT